MDLRDKSCVNNATLDQLYAARAKQANQLPDDVFDIYLNELSRTNHSEDASATLSEFNELTSVHLEKQEVQFGFVYDWYETNPDLYDLCWWINEWPFGVYFIYDRDRVLRYVGSSWDAMGNRAWAKDHEDWRHSCEVVLFPKDVGHLCLAYECYAIARLSEINSSRVKLKNKKFTSLRFPFVIPGDKSSTP